MTYFLSNRYATRREEERDSYKEIKESNVDIIEQINVDYNNKIKKIKEKLDTQLLEVNYNDKNFEILANLKEDGIINKDDIQLKH